MQRLKSLAQPLLGHDQVVIMERWSLDTKLVVFKAGFTVHTVVHNHTCKAWGQ